ncbi:hypothetical protein KR032_006274 [Drosophila birchii]|nr:hypothetical protein KR032_006274 [Drosophila birchii]
MAFNFTAFTYIVALIGDAFLIFFAIFHVIAFDELKTDYKNPIDQCNSLNPVGVFCWRHCSPVEYILILILPQLVLPEYLLHIFLNLLFLFCGEWFSLCINIPLIAYHIWRYKNRPVMSGPGLYDPTTVLKTDTLSRNMREGWIKLAVYLISFFYYIYG